LVAGALLRGSVGRGDQRRGMLQSALVVTAAAFAVLAVVHPPAAGGAVVFVAGFFLLAGLPVVLDWSELHAGEERAGAAAGFLLLAGNLGGVVLALIVQATIGNPYLSLGVLVLAGLAGLALATRLPARAAGVTHERETRGATRPTRRPSWHTSSSPTGISSPPFPNCLPAACPGRT